jgi:hypothetical protein
MDSKQGIPFHRLMTDQITYYAMSKISRDDDEIVLNVICYLGHPSFILKSTYLDETFTAHILPYV